VNDNDAERHKVKLGELYWDSELLEGRLQLEIGHMDPYLHFLLNDCAYWDRETAFAEALSTDVVSALLVRCPTVHPASTWTTNGDSIPVQPARLAIWRQVEAGPSGGVGGYVYVSIAGFDPAVEAQEIGRSAALSPGPPYGTAWG
jgi:hypothetical protein